MQANPWKKLNLFQPIHDIDQKMNTIVILYGSDSSGKTTTLRSLFNITARNSPSHFRDVRINSRRVCAVSFCSPQERVQAKDKDNFCKFELVIEDINNRIAECETKTKGEPYILLIPFTMSTKKGEAELNKGCIKKPLEFLKKCFNVFVTYIQKENPTHKDLKDGLMRQLEAYFIEPKTTHDDCDRSEELRTFLKELPI